MQARNAAIKRLQEMYADQYAAMLAEEREKRGLPRDPETAKKEKQIKTYIEKLQALGVEVKLPQ
jgi:Zn-dependent protease with chaperone function